MTKQELINKFCRQSNDCKWFITLHHNSFFINGKRIKNNDVANVIVNNLPNDVDFTVTEKKVIKPFYKGNYNYFMHSYSEFGKFKRLVNNRFYINVSTDSSK